MAHEGQSAEGRHAWLQQLLFTAPSMFPEHCSSPVAEPSLAQSSSRTDAGVSSVCGRLRIAWPRNCHNFHSHSRMNQESHPHRLCTAQDRLCAGLGSPHQEDCQQAQTPNPWLPQPTQGSGEVARLEEPTCAPGQAGPSRESAGGGTASSDAPVGPVWLPHDVA